MTTTQTIHHADPTQPGNGPACGTDLADAITSGNPDEVTCPECQAATDTQPGMASRSYVVGLPVIVTVHDDGTVTYEVDTSEAAGAIADDGSTDVTEDQRADDVAAVDAALTRVALSRLLNTPLTTPDQAAGWIRHMAFLGYGTHPDDRGADIVDMATGQPTFDPRQAARFDDRWTEVFRLVADPYAVALDAVKVAR
jgi:hypothetical protein